MEEITFGQLLARREALESAAATLLGRFLFEFARVDVNLGLCLVALDDGARREALTKQVAEWGFGKRLEYLEHAATQRLPGGSPAHTAYAEWISRADAMRQTRNELVHGRWGVDPAKEQVVNVLGLPTSPEQREVGYTLQELEAMLRELQELQFALRKVRERWPL